ncbi:MAG: hypothetical protein IKZ89_04015 [Bacteroidaceae bacterium]|nr:hypothetical protein [Bacteroidaceae bacterium]
MASRRNLKKDINYVIGDIFTECLIYKELVPGTDSQAADELIVDLLRIDNDFTARISHTEPGKAKEYYRTFVKDFQKQISEVIDKLTKLKK